MKFSSNVVHVSSAFISRDGVGAGELHPDTLSPSFTAALCSLSSGRIAALPLESCLTAGCVEARAYNNTLLRFLILYLYIV